jgi:hypothetical protein
LQSLIGNRVSCTTCDLTITSGVNFNQFPDGVHERASRVVLRPKLVSDACDELKVVIPGVTGTLKQKFLFEGDNLECSHKEYQQAGVFSFHFKRVVSVAGISVVLGTRLVWIPRAEKLGYVYLL